MNAEEPEVKDKLWLPAQGVSNLRGWTNNAKPVWFWVETTHISKSGSGRKPTPSEVKAEIWLALIAGAQGYGYFCHQFYQKEDDQALLDDPAMSAAVKKINAEVAALTPALHTPDVVGMVSATSANGAVPISTAGKAVEGAHYVFAAAERNGTTAATFTLGAGVTATGAEVIGEGRTLEVQGGKFSDQFVNFGVHLYKLS